MHNSKLWTIWMTNPVVNNTRLKWDFHVCSSCLVNWIETKAGLNFIPFMNDKFERVKEKADCTIPWINYKWAESDDLELKKQKHMLTYNECFEFLK